jgi:hypothetical protein
MMPIMNEVLDERLSFLARHYLSGEIVGALSDLMQELEDTFLRRHFGHELKPQMVLHAY